VVIKEAELRPPCIMDPTLVNPKTEQYNNEELSVQRTQSLISTRENIHMSWKSLQDPNLGVA